MESMSTSNFSKENFNTTLIPWSCPQGYCSLNQTAFDPQQAGNKQESTYQNIKSIILLKYMLL